MSDDISFSMQTSLHLILRFVRQHLHLYLVTPLRATLQNPFQKLPGSSNTLNLREPVLSPRGISTTSAKLPYHASALIEVRSNHLTRTSHIKQILLRHPWCSSHETSFQPLQPSIIIDVAPSVMPPVIVAESELQAWKDTPWSK